jgi:hypothetical protein
LKLNGKDLHKTKEHRNFGEMNDSFSFSLDNRISSNLAIQFCRDQFSTPTVLATSILSLDKILINQIQEVDMLFSDTSEMILSISYLFEADRVSSPSAIYWNDDEANHSFEKIERRSTNQTKRPSTVSKRSSVSRQSSYRSQ